MLTMLPAEFSSHQCGQRSSKLEKSRAYGNHTGTGLMTFEANSSLFKNTQDCLTDSNSLFLDVGVQFLPSKNVEMDVAEREDKSWG